MVKTDIRCVGVAGTGLIGASWAAYFLGRGLDVVATDPAPGAEARLRTFIERAWPTLTELGLAAGADPGRLRFAPDLQSCAAEVDFVQENGPEREGLKIETFARLDAAAPPDVILSSSTSGFQPSLLQSRCRHPGRVLVGHPFNPPHIIPLVEVVGGEKTSPEAIEAALAFYRGIGKTAIHIRKELVGHVANRLQGALAREAYHLVATGAVTVAELDAAISYGPGLRWALMGPLLLQHLAGGPGGMRRSLEHLGPIRDATWADLGKPQVDEALAGKLIEGVEQEMAGLDEAAMIEERDRLLVRLVKARADAAHLP